MPDRVDEPGEVTTLEPGEVALREADVIDQLDAASESDWWLTLMLIPALAGLAFATWIAFSVLGGGGFGAWLITNGVLFVAALQGARIWKGRERRRLERERAALAALPVGEESKPPGEDA